MARGTIQRLFNRGSGPTGLIHPDQHSAERDTPFRETDLLEGTVWGDLEEGMRVKYDQPTDDAYAGRVRPE